MSLLDAARKVVESFDCMCNLHHFHDCPIGALENEVLIAEGQDPKPVWNWESEKLEVTA